MAVRVEVEYAGELVCSAVHGPSGEHIRTDAPVDNHGRGAHFSPTDLVAAAAGSCMLTTMALAARARGWRLPACRAAVEKEMGAQPRRHISRLAVVIYMPARLEEPARQVLERAALGCPVSASLGPDTRVEVRFIYE